MTFVQIRTSPREAPLDGHVLLDLFGSNSHASTIQCSAPFSRGSGFSPISYELFALASGIYCADKLISRGETTDGWTRDLEIQMAVRDVNRWEEAKPVLEETLSFLSGDRVGLTFSAIGVDADELETGQLTMDATSVCLFSGGLDSLIGAVDLLEQGQRIVLVGHHDSPKAENRQEDLYNQLVNFYGEGLITRRPLYLKPAQPNATQERPLLSGTSETTTRTRSFLFVASAIAVASSIRPGVPVYMPENGPIGVNVPLTLSRSGSLSTRTTHPLYLSMFGRVTEILGLDHPIENPYRLMTKGEMISSCIGQEALERMAKSSISCAHPEAPRWHGGEQNGCGTCYPCLIRRAAMHRVGWDSAADYDTDALDNEDLFKRNWTSGASLRSLLQSLSRPTRPADVLMNGRIPNGETLDFYEVWTRGRSELRDWLITSTSPDLLRRIN